MITVFFQGKTFTEVKDKLQTYEATYPARSFGTRINVGPELDDRGQWFVEVRRSEQGFGVDKR